MTQEINRRLHEALGKCWHEYPPAGMCACAKCGYYGVDINPDYTADPRLVIEAMREREDWAVFRSNTWSIDGTRYDIIDLIMDNTGKLAKLATEWIERGK